MRLKVLVANLWSPVFAQIDLKFCTITISDGTDSITLQIGEGNLTYSEKRNIEYTLDRGVLATGEIREGDEVPVDVSFDAIWTYLTASGTQNVEDILKSANSSDSDTCRPSAVDITVVYQPLPSECGDGWTLLLPDYRYEDISHDLRAGTISSTGKCNVKEVNFS